MGSSKSSKQILMETTFPYSYEDEMHIIYKYNTSEKEVILESGDPVVMESGDLNDNIKESGEEIKSENLPEKVTLNEVVESIPLEDESKELERGIRSAKTQEELDRYTQLFNLNLQKKNSLRILKYNALLDKVSDVAIERVDKRPDEISTGELLSYMKVVQESINNTQTNNEKIKENKAFTEGLIWNYISLC